MALRPFAPLFKKAGRAGLGITVHAGEVNMPSACGYVRDAIRDLGAERIGHGIQIQKSPELRDEIKQRGVVLELCPTSNWLIGAVPSKREHPFRQFFDEGLKTTVNSDDPGIFNIDLTHEYQLLADHYGFSEREFDQCNDVAARASFIPHERKQKAWPRPIGLSP